jgi:hypothetical protein
VLPLLIGSLPESLDNKLLLLRINLDLVLLAEENPVQDEDQVQLVEEEEDQVLQVEEVVDLELN